MATDGGGGTQEHHARYGMTRPPCPQLQLQEVQQGDSHDQRKSEVIVVGNE